MLTSCLNYSTGEGESVVLKGCDSCNMAPGYNAAPETEGQVMVAWLAPPTKKICSFFRVNQPSLLLFLSFPRDPGEHESDIQVCTPIFGKMYLFSTYQKMAIPPSSNNSFISFPPLFPPNYKTHAKNNIYNND